MKKWIVAVAVTIAVGAVGAAPAFADNPHTTPGSTGQPSQSCQSFSATTRPGNTASSPGAPFNEPMINSTNGGTGGANYSASSQYDVACFQWAQHH